MKSLHNLLARQLARLGLDASRPPDATAWDTLLARVSETYADADRERYLLERSQAISSREMEELNAKLELERDRLESRVRERTAELAASEARFRSFTSLGSDWYWEQDAQFRFTSIAGNTEVYPGHTIGSHIGRTRWEIDDYDAPAGGWDEHRRLLESHQPFHEVVFRLKVPNGGRAYASVSGLPMFDDEGRFTGYRGIGRDITEQKLTEENIRRLARFDPLTGLANRTSLFEHVEHAIARSRRHPRPFAVLFVDLDRFKDVNDAFGHVDRRRRAAHDGPPPARSRSARATPWRASAATSSSSLAEEVSPATVVAEFSRGCCDTLAEPIVLQGKEFRVGASIGIAMFPADGEDAPTLLKKRRHGDVPGQGVRAQRLRVLRRRDAQRAAGAHGARVRSAPRDRGRRARAVLPAEDRGARRHDDRRGGTDSLAASAARAAAAGHVHTARRGLGPDPSDRPLGAAYRVPAGEGVAVGRRRTRFPSPSTSRRASSATTVSPARSPRRSRTPACRRVCSSSRSPRAS